MYSSQAPYFKIAHFKLILFGIGGMLPCPHRKVLQLIKTFVFGTNIKNEINVPFL